MSELDPVPPTTGAREWWHSVYGPMDPLAAQYLAVTWRRTQHGQQCPFYTHDGTPYDCDCWHRAQAICAAALLRLWAESQWANPVAEDNEKSGVPPAGRTEEASA